MAWNPSPQVAAARDFGKKFGKNQVIILHFDKDGRVGYASYGETKSLCDNTKKIADKIFDWLMDDLSPPFQP